MVNSTCNLIKLIILVLGLLFIPITLSSNNSHRTESTSARRLASLNYTNPWNIVTTPALPRGTEKLAIGYDQQNDKIWIIGGFSGQDGQQLVSFANGGFTDYGRLYFPSPIAALGQAYSQLNQYVYIIHSSYSDYTIDRFNVESATIEYNYIDIPTVATIRGCLATININDGYLVVMGGRNSSTAPFHDLNSVQLYDIGNNSWLTDIPFLQQTRADFACEVDNKNKQLYAIGGNTQNGLTIEVLQIGDISNIKNEQWRFIGNLSTYKSNHRAAVYGNDIIVVGGYTEIYTIDTSNNEVRLIGYLDVDLYSCAIIVVGNILYVFGGYAKLTENGNFELLSSWRYIHLPLSVLYSISQLRSTLVVIYCTEKHCFQQQHLQWIQRLTRQWIQP